MVFPSPTLKDCDIGPQGTLSGIQASNIPLISRRPTIADNIREKTKAIEVRGTRKNNIKNMDVDMPL